MFYKHPRLPMSSVHIKVTLHKDTNITVKTKTVPCVYEYRRCSNQFTWAPVRFAADRCIYLTLNKLTTSTHIARTHKKTSIDLTGDSNLTVSSAHNTQTRIHLYFTSLLCSTLLNGHRSIQLLALDHTRTHTLVIYMELLSSFIN